MNSNWQPDLVSIIMPCYNANDTILASIESVLNQTYSNWELLIVDDCSTDASLATLKELQDPRIHVLALAENSGVAVARNRAIQMAAGQYIAFLDSDDSWMPDKLSKQLAFMRQNKAAISYTEYYIVQRQRKKLVKVPATLTYKQLLKNTIMGCLTVIIDRHIVGQVRMPQMRTRQDTATWLSILKQGYTAHGLQEPLAQYVITNDSLSGKKTKMLRQNWHLYRDVEGLAFLPAAYVFVCYATNAVKKRIF
ncbi:glycosyltransferase family 2 protein [Listeria booriae]|uniref:glycosyltransferase family 2 protein n=1 Tax=Listeria booriae TaxID=1552123 RepID=UPI002893068C|nr:glycosyltransferase family 2 protein [Listeria booriae]